MYRAGRIVRRAGAVAVLAILLLAQDALALTWGPRIAITTSRNASASPHALAVSSTTTAHLVYEDAAGGIRSVWYRRSTDGGSTWGTPFRLSAPAALIATDATISAVGSAVDAVWLEGAANGNWVVMYRRSTNAGVSWDPIVALTTTSVSVFSVRVARDSAGHVLMAYTDGATGSVRVRRSLDGGSTWQVAAGLGTTTNQPYGDATLDGFPVVAAGTGAVYLAWVATSTTTKFRRSTDGGATWTAAVTVMSTGAGLPVDLAASGSLVVLGYASYVSGQLHTVIRRSTDKGSTWKSALALAPTTGAWSWVPVLAVNGSTVRVVFERDATLAGSASSTYFRRSTDSGVTWSASEKVSNTPRSYGIPVGVAAATSTVVTWFDWSPDVIDSDVYVRLGS